MERATIRLAIKKETKNTVHYKSEDPESVAITDIYVKKSKLNEPYPVELEITVQVPDTGT